MSIEAMKAVDSYKGLNSLDPYARLILVFLGKEAGKHDQKAYPLLETIAKEVNCSTRTVNRKLKLLESLELIICIGRKACYDNRKVYVPNFNKLENKLGVTEQFLPNLSAELEIEMSPMEESDELTDDDMMIGVSDGYEYTKLKPKYFNNIIYIDAIEKKVVRRG